jgi:hypothetical protein
MNSQPPQKTRSPDQQALYEYILTERLGFLCDDRKPTPEQLAIAEKEAEKAVRETPR